MTDSKAQSAKRARFSAFGGRHTPHNSDSCILTLKITEYYMTQTSSLIDTLKGHKKWTKIEQKWIKKLAENGLKLGKR